MSILAVDLGSTFGWFDGKNGGSISVGKDKKMFNFYKIVLDKILTYSKNGNTIKTIVFEDAKFQQGNAIYNFHGQKAILELIADSFNIKFVGVPVKTAKKFITGNGNADKEVVAKAITKLGYKYTDLNHSDAISVYLTYKNSIKEV